MIGININLPTGYYLDYFGYLFPRDPESGAYAVSSTTDIGKLLIAYAKISDKPVQTSGGGKATQTVTLSLPLTSTSQDLRNKWLYYTEADTARLQAVLRTEFNLDFIAYNLRGSAMGHQRPRLIRLQLRWRISSDRRLLRPLRRFTPNCSRTQMNRNSFRRYRGSWPIWPSGATHVSRD